MSAINSLTDYAAIRWAADNQHLLTSGVHIPTKVTQLKVVWGQVAAVSEGTLAIDDPRVLPATRQSIELQVHLARAASEALDIVDYCQRYGLEYIDDPMLPDGTYRSQPLCPLLWAEASPAERAWPYSTTGDAWPAIEH